MQTSPPPFRAPWILFAASSNAGGRPRRCPRTPPKSDTRPTSWLVTRPSVELSLYSNLERRGSLCRPRGSIERRHFLLLADGQRRAPSPLFYKPLLGRLVSGARCATSMQRLSPFREFIVIYSDHEQFDVLLAMVVGVLLGTTRNTAALGQCYEKETG